VTAETQFARMRVSGDMHRPRLTMEGQPLRQRELCERHAAWLKAKRPNIHAGYYAPRSPKFSCLRSLAGFLHSESRRGERESRKVEGQ
jgi:hypothetical protein